MERLLKLCGKYGRICYEADGTYPNENKWESAYASIGPLLRDYAGYLVFAQKNNILHRQFVSQSATLGLYLSGAITNQGAWEDGGWYWQQVGFRQLGDIRGQRGGVVRDMPRNFWAINFAMGLARGCAIFSLDGQTGTARVPVGHRIAEKGMPAGASPSAYWTSEGELTPAYHRFVAPFLRAVLRHQLVPTQAQLRDPIRLAVYNDGVRPAAKADPYYYEYHALYAGTYGFRPAGVIPGELMEFFPNTGRYHYIPVLPQGRTDLGGGIKVLPLSQLQDAAAVKTRFDAAYPSWYDGDALVNLVGDTLTVLNTNENLDVTERYAVPLPGRGSFQQIAGRIGPHAYVIGKFENRNRRLWLQANTEYPDRDTELTVSFKSHPKVTVTPASAARVNRWDPATKTLTLALAHAEGAVEAVIEELETAYVPIPDDPRLPRVLLIGDSVSIAYTLDVRKELAGVANVHRVPANCGSTRTALGSYGLERWLDGSKWDVIHFNFGLHDLSYRFADDSDKDAAGHYATPHNGGHQNVPPAGYEQNLRTIISRLRQTGAKLIFATTTPVPESDAGKYVPGSEVPYNQIARAVATAEGVTLNDLWAVASPQLAQLQIPRNVHFHSRGSAELAQHVAAAIRRELNNR
jgi:acyl-CoA thioesterase-1